jgi:hypothetical protein
VKVWALIRHTTPENPCLNHPDNRRIFEIAFFSLFVLFGLSSVIVSTRLWGTTCIDETDPKLSTAPCSDLAKNNTAHHWDKFNTGNIGALSCDAAAAVFGLFCAWWDGTLSMMF